MYFFYIIYVLLFFIYYSFVIFAESKAFSVLCLFYLDFTMLDQNIYVQYIPHVRLNILSCDSVLLSVTRKILTGPIIRCHWCHVRVIRLRFTDSLDIRWQQRSWRPAQWHFHRECTWIWLKHFGTIHNAMDNHIAHTNTLFSIIDVRCGWSALMYYTFLEVPSRMVALIAS